MLFLCSRPIFEFLQESAIWIDAQHDSEDCRLLFHDSVLITFGWTVRTWKFSESTLEPSKQFMSEI